jgi:hypothetical protein
MELMDGTPQSNAEIPALSRIMGRLSQGPDARIAPLGYTEWPVENGFRSTMLQAARF